MQCWEHDRRGCLVRLVCSLLDVGPHAFVWDMLTDDALAAFVDRLVASAA